MSYLVLARKYRPQTFEELVGQEHVSTTLINAMDAKRLAHAYIFSGPRGCGKTTTARILARALNCAQGPTPHPCGQCSQCLEISSGNSPDDVIEIDGASNRGIDQIRDLRDTVKYAPARSRYRIIIIDEAHQITEAGFNALLKTLEEPPPHAVFMLATTDVQKFPATILSRCQRFQLKSISPAGIQQQLKKIADLEKIRISPEALLEVARSANGSLRDALSLLDQVIAYSPDGATDKDIRALLGLLPRETVRAFADVLREGVPEKTLAAVQKAVSDGFDLFQLAHDLTSFWHGLLLAKSGVPDSFFANSSEAQELAGLYTLPRLERNLQIISRTTEQMRRSEASRVTFELACLELSKKTMSADEILSRLEDLEKNLRDADFPTTTPGRPPAADAPTLKKKVAEPAAPPPAALPTPPPLPAAPPPPAKESSLTDTDVRIAWPGILQEIGKKKPALEPSVAEASWELKPQGNIVVYSSKEFHHQQILAQIPLLQKVLADKLSAAVHVQCHFKPKPAPVDAAPKSLPAAEPTPEEMVAEEAEDSGFADDNSRPEPAKTTESAADNVDAEEIVRQDLGAKKLLDRFPGKIKKIHPTPVTP
ncbi:MAG TPA: DNA polymerase III subunit gamma/tau [Elusimicrobiota bacterium]|nr:DNA polymerase III subunit gamma/tau [Elusimicrobiota bacterium]